jgi:hypothetical protein
MAMFNDLFDLLADVPMTLVLAWVGWFATGALIVMWYRRADPFDASLPAAAPRPAAGAASKPKPASRPASHPDLHAPEAMADPHAAPVAHIPADKKPVVIGDPFGDLATLLDQPGPAVATEYTPPPAAEPPRAPADSPILSSSGSPIRRPNPPEPGH